MNEHSPKPPKSFDSAREKSLTYTDKDKENTPTSSRLLNAYIIQRLPPLLNAATSGYNTLSKPGETDGAVCLDDPGEVSKPPLPSCNIRCCSTLGPTVNYH